MAGSNRIDTANRAPAESLVPVMLSALPALPGEFAIRTEKGFYLTAINGGGRNTAPVIITSTTKAGPWEKFTLSKGNPLLTHDRTIQTASGNYLTSVSGGGRTTDVLHTDAMQLRDWERYRLLYLGITAGAPTYYAIQTIKGNFLTAVGAGGKYEDAMHSDASRIQAWERFRFVKCGDPGTEHEYGIMAADGSFLTARGGGGLTSGAISKGYPGEPDARFTLLRQDDGSYAFRTANGVNFLTALQGGGLVQKYVPPDCGWWGACIGGFTDIFHTDATQIRGWEKFKVIDRGDCTYEIQTISGFDMGIFQSPQGYWLLTTRRDGVSSVNETFQLVAYGLESEPILH